MKRALLAIILVVCSMATINAKHIVGGEIRMEATGTADRFTFTLIQFYDQNTVTDGVRTEKAELLLYRRRDDKLVHRVTLPYISSQSISYQNKACAAARILRTEISTYSTVEIVNPLDFADSRGYYIIWERCCRNDDINNIVDPGGSGMVFYLEFPPLSFKNSSPVFTDPNGEYICKDVPFTMNAVARDADGDELRYSLVTPMRGSTTKDYPDGNDRPKAGYYSLIRWAPGYSEQDMIPGKPALSVDPATGRISVVANRLGLYVFTIQCEEYRNGKRIGLVRRDFQLLVIECERKVPPEPIITYNQTRSALIEFCAERPIQLETEAAANWAYQWQRNGQNISGANQSRVTVKDTGSYTVIKSFKDVCSRDTASQSVRLFSGSLPPAVIYRDNDTLCAGSKLDLMANLGNDYAYEWKKDQQRLPDKSPILSVSETANYHLLVRNEKSGCTARDSARITVETVSAKLPDQLAILLGNTVPLAATVRASVGPLRYRWSPDIELTGTTDFLPKISPTESRQYSLTVTTPHGCVAIDSILVKVFDKLYIPDAFSPNGDGINDVLVIQNGSEQIEKIRIFDRWGRLVFYAKNYNTPWDGHFKESIVPAGSYIYLVETNYHTYKGTLYVLY